MKKTLRIAMLLCLVLTLMLTATACLEQFGNFTNATTPAATPPEATTPDATSLETTTPDVTTPEITTPEDQPDPDMPEDGVPVESIGGKNAGELLEQFAKDFENAESVYWDGAMSTTQDGVTIQQFVSIKAYNGELALRLEEDGVFNGVYFVDGILYVNSNGEKLKISANSVDEVLGEGAIDSLLSETSVTFSEAEIAAAAKAQIYFVNQKYLVTVHTINEESGLEEESKFYFNAAGELTDASCFSDEGYSLLTIHSYNKPVEINPPADADEYVWMGGTTPNPDPNAPEGAVAVGSLNGMNATQLYEKFLAEYMSSQTYDIFISHQQLTDIGTLTMSTTTKVNEDSIYYAMEMDGELMEMWIIDGVAYINTYGEKMKYEDVTVEDLLGEGFLESLLGSLLQDIPEEYYTALSTAQLYFKDGIYFFTVTLSLPEMGIDSMTETVFFNENGKVICVIDSGAGLYSQSIIKTYGGPVEILPPEDADEYITESDIPGGDITVEMPETEDEIYALYSDMCTMLQNSDHFSVYIDIGGVYYVVYEIAGENKYLLMSAEQTIEQWLIDNIGYISVDYENIQTTNPDAAFLEGFSSVEELFPIGAFLQNELQSLRCSYDEDFGEIIIQFEYTEGLGSLSQCKYAIAEDASYVDITITEYINGQEDGNYTFYFVFDPELEIVLPALE